MASRRLKHLPAPRSARPLSPARPLPASGARGPCPLCCAASCPAFLPTVSPSPRSPLPPSSQLPSHPPSHSWSDLQPCSKHLHVHQQRFPHTGLLATTIGLLAPAQGCTSAAQLRAPQSGPPLDPSTQPFGCLPRPSELPPAPSQGEPGSLLVAHLKPTCCSPPHGDSHHARTSPPWTPTLQDKSPVSPLGAISPQLRAMSHPSTSPP